MIDRRRVLEAGVLALAATGVGVVPLGPRPLRLESRATGERIALRPAELTPASRARLAWVLRDPATDEHAPLDPQLLSALVGLAAALGVPPTYEVLCGFRSPGRRRESGGLHALGRALDVRLVGVGSGRLAAVAPTLLRGGVGHYRGADFVHLDTGTARRWVG